jgi:uncharacterized LabA/DUF88 family protein
MISSKKIALFIDGPSLYHTARSLGFDLDFKRLLSEFERRSSLLRAYYYSTVVEGAGFHAARPLLDWLAYNGFAVVTKPAKEFDDGEGRRGVKRNLAIEMVVDALEISKHVDQIVLFSGDGDFRPMIEAVQRRGVHVTVVSSIKTRPPMVAEELRRQADAFFELDELKGAIGRMETTGRHPRS